MTLNQATVTESMISATLTIAIALPLATIGGLKPTYAGVTAAAVVGIGNLIYWKGRGESVREVYSTEGVTENGGEPDR